jgi:hypothetical protein
MKQHPSATATTYPTPRPESIPGAGTAARPAAQRITGCRWIEGDVRNPDWRYCQARRLPGRSYCPAHHARSINPDGDPQFMAEQTECDPYLRDLPPPDMELADDLDDELGRQLDGPA